MFWSRLIGLFLPNLFMGAGMVAASRRLMHYFQLESYQFQGYFRTLRRQWKKSVLPYAGLGLGWFLFFGVSRALMTRGHALLFSPFETKKPLSLLAVVAYLIVDAVLLYSAWMMRDLAVRQPAKKKFALTSRMKRLYGILAVLTALLLWGSSALGLSYGGWGLAAALLPLLLPLAAVLALPVEKCIFRLYFRDAEKRLLANPNLIRIGITGSYGKTSVKFILAEILSQKYRVLATPSSFNTPMGVTRIVRERLEPSHQVFIGEMGARHVGEIRELCRLVHPGIGVLTAVGPQHLDTFRTIDRIKNTKYELIDALTPDGFAVFSDDGALVTELFHRDAACMKALAGRPGDDAWADEITLSGEGSRFMLHLKGEEPFPCQTVLLGAHNIQNILLCAVVARHLGLTHEQISRGIARLKPVEHRLQLLHTPGDITVIDDAFNTNPRSSALALDVLSAFSGRRIIVTPGMVELGAEEKKFNFDFGVRIASSADEVFLVGQKHTQPICEGLRSAGFPAEHLHVCASLQEATDMLHGMMRAGDIIMYENDLPDHYSE